MRYKKLAEIELAQIHEEAGRYDTAFSTLVLTRLEYLADSLGCGSTDQVLADLAEITMLYQGKPIFTSMSDFQAFMADPTSSLVLHLGGRRR